MTKRLGQIREGQAWLRSLGIVLSAIKKGPLLWLSVLFFCDEIDICFELLTLIQPFIIKVFKYMLKKSITSHTTVILNELLLLLWNHLFLVIWLIDHHAQWAIQFHFYMPHYWKKACVACLINTSERL